MRGKLSFKDLDVDESNNCIDKDIQAFPCRTKCQYSNRYAECSIEYVSYFAVAVVNNSSRLTYVKERIFVNKLE